MDEPTNIQPALHLDHAADNFNPLQEINDE